MKRQQTKYKDYKPIQKCEDVNISVYCCNQTTACYCYMQLDYSYANTGRSLHFNQIFVQHWESVVEHIFFDFDSDYSKVLFSTPALTPTPRENLRLPRLRLPVKTLDSLDSDSRLRLCNTGPN